MSLVRLSDDLPRRGQEVTIFGVKAGAMGKKEALDALSKFIPVEMLAPYVAFLAYAAENKSPSPELIYWCFVAATPFLAAFFQYAKSAMENQPWPVVRGVAWRMIAATVAFAVWGLAPPGSAYQAGVGGPVIAGLLAVLVSPLLIGADAIVLRLIGIKRVS